MKRRGFLALIGGGVASWPLLARAQPAATPVIGFLHVAPAKGLLHIVEAVRESVKEAGADVVIVSRWAEGQNDRLSRLAAELVQRKAAVIVAGGHAAALTAKDAAPTTPIVFVTGGDPVADGLVVSLSRPGGNATGVSLAALAIGPKRLELMRELVPRTSLVAVLTNPNNMTIGPEMQHLEAAASAMGQKLLVLDGGSPQAIDAAFAAIIQQQAGALLITVDSSFNSRRDQIIALAARHRVPAMYYSREFAASGGLISYGTDIPESYRQVGGYVARILQGAKPADLPVLQPSKFDLVINMKTAKALGLAIPRLMLARANQVIE